MALVIRNEPEPQKSQWVDFDEENKFLINPDGLNEYRIVMDRSDRYQEALTAVILKTGFNDDAYKVDRTKETSLFDKQRKAIAHHILKDWEGDITFNGERVLYSVQEAYKLLANVEVFKFVIEKAIELEAAYFTEQIETLGKSLSDSNGKSSGATGRSKKV